MMARVAFLVALVLTILFLVLTKTPKKETISLVAPTGYAAAQKIEAPKPDTFVSALEYAQALSPEPELVQVPEPMKVVKVAPPASLKKVKTAHKRHAKRQIAKTKSKKTRLVARW